LATLVTKSIAAEVCRLAPLESSKQLINLITHRAAESDGTHRLFANKGDIPRFRKALSNWCRTKYKIDTENAGIKVILDEVVDWAIALPNKRTRGRQKQPRNIADWLRQQTATLAKQ
jgi:hypothetical protein